MTVSPLDRAWVERCARFALAAVERPHPYHLSIVLEQDEDLAPPRVLTPAFSGAFDWHSAVHGHWALARAARALETGEVAATARETLARRLAPKAIATELKFLSAPARGGFERPYGLAWVLQLAAEVREWDTPEARGALAALAPLERHAVENLYAWLPRLPFPVRSGEHSQTAFALGLAIDRARGAGDDAFLALACARARDFYGADRDAPIHYEPSGSDFLSPVLAEADLMRRVLEPGEFRPWFARFLPSLGTPEADAWLTPVTSPDPSDGKLSHLDGLNLSRAWMLEGVAAALPAGDGLATWLMAAAARHRAAGIRALDETRYAGAHWLGSFALYLITRRGLPVAPPGSGASNAIRA
jgi:Protein of unknown function (DUF2891)